MANTRTLATPTSATSTTSLRLCIVGPMLGVNPGWVTTQGEVLAEALAREGYRVRVTSHVPARLPRLVDTLRSIYAWRNEIDLVIHQVFSGPAFVINDAASLLCRMLGLRQVYVLHGGSLPEFAMSRSGWVRRVMRRADAIVAPSRYLSSLVEGIPGITERIRVIPNILAIEGYPYRHRREVQPRLLWMRTFHAIYHPEMAVDVLANLRQTHPAATLTMAGQEKGLHVQVQEKARQMGLIDAIRFPGFLGPEDKAREFGAHDIYLNTNHVDNMPVSVVEAAAFGLPIVATRVGGIPYLLTDDETALLTPDGDAEAMAAAVRRLLHEPDLAARLSVNGRALAEDCAWKQVKAQWETLFQELAHA